jgi:hypothetical protein
VLEQPLRAKSAVFLKLKQAWWKRSDLHSFLSYIALLLLRKTGMV